MANKTGNNDMNRQAPSQGGGNRMGQERTQKDETMRGKNQDDVQRKNNTNDMNRNDQGTGKKKDY